MKIQHTLPSGFIKTLVSLIIALLIMAWNINCFGQDSLRMRSGTSVAVKLMEIKPYELVYKRFDNPEGPVYILNKSEVSSVLYSNGAVDTFPRIVPQQSLVQQPITPSSIKISIKGDRFMMDNKFCSERKVLIFMQQRHHEELNKYIRKAKTAKALRPVCFVAIPMALVGLGMLSEGGGNNASSNAIGGGLIVASGAGLGFAIALKNVQHKNSVKAVQIYNANF